MIAIPTLAQIFTTVKSNLEAVFETTIPSYGFSVLRGFAAVHASALKSQYLVLGKIQKNLLPDTAEPEASGGTLERWGRIFLNRNPFPATQGEYVVTVTGDAGATIPASTTFQSAQGYLYVLDNAYTLIGTDDTITLRSLTAGTDALLSVTQELTSTTQLLNVDNTATVYSITTTPEDAEDLEVYRAKILDAIRLPAGSWSAIDYRLVGDNVTGVQQIYAYAVSGEANEVNVFIEGQTPGVAPSGDVIDDVETAIEAVRPLSVFLVNYAACPLKEIDITIEETITLTTAQRTLIENALEDAINSVRPFIAACDDISTRNDSLAIDYTLEYCTNLYQVIASAIPGVPFGDVSFTVSGTPETAYNFDNGEIPYLGTVTYA